MKILKLKLRILKFLGKFIPYFRRKMMGKLHDRIHIDVMNHIQSYSNLSSFNIVRLNNTANENIVKYQITCQCVNFYISIELNDKISIAFLCEVVNNIETFSLINDFVCYFKTLDYENLQVLVKHYQ